MTSIRSRPVDPMSLMTDVFVELERLTRNLEALRDELVQHPEQRYHVELSDARHHCRKIDLELRCIKSLLWGQPKSKDDIDAPPPPKGPPSLKIIS